MATSYTTTTFIDNSSPPVNASFLNALQTFVASIANGGSGSVCLADLATRANVWASTIAYSVNDFVNRNGKLYFCLVANTGADPATDSGTNWALFSGSIAWVSTQAYSVNTFVSRNGKLYIALQSSTNVDPATDSGSYWQVFKSGGGGTTSYLTNPDFESLPGTTGYQTYNDGSVATPTDGISGTASGISIARNTTSPLFGTADLVLTKTAVNCQGQGFSTDFTIDSGAVGQPLSIKFNYRIGTVSGYTDNDIGVYIYDKTNSNIMYPQQINLTGNNGAITAYSSLFFPSTSTSYRLIFHIQGTDTTAYSFEVDNISIAIQQTINSTALSGWQSYVPTIYGLTTAPTKGTMLHDLAYYRRVGTNIEVYYQLQQTAAGSAGSGTYFIGLPPGLSINTSIVPDRQVVGEAKLANIIDTEGSTSNDDGLIFSDGAGDIYVCYHPAGITTDVLYAWSSGYYGFSNATLQCSFHFTVPINQWTVSTNLATDYTEYASNSSSTAANDTTSFVYGMGGSTGIIGTTAISSYITKRVRFTKAIQPTDILLIELYNPTNGAWANSFWKSIIISTSYLSSTSQGGISLSQVNSTDVDVIFWPTPDGASAWTNSNISGVKWRVRKISNGNTAEVPPLVRAEYTSSATVVPTSTATLLQMTTKVEDTHNAMTMGASTKFTAPLAGVYQVEAFAGNPSVASSTLTSFSLYLFKNGSVYNVLQEVSIPTNSIGMFCYGSQSIRLNLGDYIQIYQIAGSNTSGNFTLARFAVTRIGN